MLVSHATGFLSGSNHPTSSRLHGKQRTLRSELNFRSWRRVHGGSVKGRVFHPVWQRHVVYRNGWCFNAETAWIKAMLYFPINILHRKLLWLRIFCVRSQPRIVTAIQWSGENFVAGKWEQIQNQPMAGTCETDCISRWFDQVIKNIWKVESWNHEEFILDSLIWAGKLLGLLLKCCPGVGVVW